MMKEQLLKRIEAREIICGVVGLGYVGLPLAVEKAKAGFRTIGFDVQDKKVDMVNQGYNYIGDVVDNELKELVEQGMLRGTSGYQLCQILGGGYLSLPETQHYGGTGIHHISRYHRGSGEADSGKQFRTKVRS